MDHSALSLLQNSTYRLEEQCASQFVAEQMLSEGGKGTGNYLATTRNFVSSHSNISIDKTAFVAEYGQRIALAGRTAIQTKSDTSAEPFFVSSGRQW